MMTIGIVGRLKADVPRASTFLMTEFDLSKQDGLRLEESLLSFVPERFQCSYASGADLASQRVFGLEMRSMYEWRAEIPSAQIFAFDPLTFELNGMIEFIDRHGVAETMRLFELSPRRGSSGIIIGAPRVDPISAEDALPPLREALACLYEEMTGRKPSKKDFRKVRGTGRKIALRHSTAHFIRAALCSIGWTYTDADIARNYRNLLSIPWRLSDFVDP